jgi:F-type H+-transporting ATPase subunit epsilon
MAETTRLELVTPARIMAGSDVEMVVIPGSEGLLGVLPRHAPLLANLARGAVEIYQGGKIVQRFLIDGGVADISPEKVILLAERAVELTSASAADLKTRAEAASGDEADFLLAAAEAV